MITPLELIAFEEEIAAEFNAAAIRAPVHLTYGNEKVLVEIFQRIRPQDWILCSWRSHYHCLLKGVQPNVLKKKILDGQSISLCFAEQRVFSSAIVGGVVPIAVGIGMGIKRSGTGERVYCFMGEMTAETGIAHESIKYSRMHCLPVTWVIEDNEKSVCTDTKSAWGLSGHWWETETDSTDVISYRYCSKYPHAGAGVRVQF